MKTVNVNLTVDDYTNRVLGVVKEKYGLHDKGEALIKIAHTYGHDLVEEEVQEDVVKAVIDRCNAHIKKYGYRKMTGKQLDELFGVN